MLNRQLTQLDSSWAQKNQTEMQNAAEVIEMCQPMVDDAIRQVIYIHSSETVFNKFCVLASAGGHISK
jgi:hypothetical protein